MTIRILLIDDHTLFRSGIRALLQRQADFEIVDEAADGVSEVVHILIAVGRRPDVPAGHHEHEAGPVERERGDAVVGHQALDAVPIDEAIAHPRLAMAAPIGHDE